MTVRDLSHRDRAGWIASPGYDLSLLSLSPLLGIVACVLVAGQNAVLVSAVSLFLLGMPHYLSTYTFAMDDANRSYYRTRRWAFLAGPVLVVGLMTVALKLHVYVLVAAVVNGWNVFHVSRQSSGILSLYRHLNGGASRLEKVPANLALLGSGAGLFALHIDKDPGFGPLLKGTLAPAAPWVGPALIGLGGLALGALLFRMLRRPGGVSASEWVFLGASLLVFLPFVLVGDRAIANATMLSGHYVQYLGLIWLLNHRKYRALEGSAPQRLLALVSRRPGRILLLLACVVLLTTAVDRLVHFANAMVFHTWILNVVVLLHFYFDGFFWAFKRPFVRQSVGPYLAPSEPSASAA